MGKEVDRHESIPSEDPYKEAARQVLEQAPRSPEYVPDPMELEDHVPVYIPEPEYLVPSEDEAPMEDQPLSEFASAPTPPLPPPSFLPSLIQPSRTRAAMAHMRAAAPSTYHSLLPSGTPPLLPIPLPAPSTSRRADIPEADMPLRKRLLLTAPTPRFEVGETFAAAAARQPGSTMARRVDHSFVDTVDTREDRCAVRAKIEIFRRERLAYEQESIETRQALARSEAYSRALEAMLVCTLLHRSESTGDLYPVLPSSVQPNPATALTVVSAHTWHSRLGHPRLSIFDFLLFETYVKSKDLDLWHIITDGDFPPIQNNLETKKDEIVPFHKQNDDLKKKLAKNNEAKMDYHKSSSSKLAILKRLKKSHLKAKVKNMPRATVGDTALTRSYIPKVSQTPGISPTIANFYKPIENQCIREGRVVDQLYYTSDHIDHCFSNKRLDCVYEINEPIVPRFILDFYSQVTLQRDDSGYILISFMIQNEFITLSLAQFSQILRIPYNGQAVFTNELDLGSLAYSQETEEPYRTDLPTPEDIHQFLQFQRVNPNRTIKSKNVILTPNQVLTKELRQDLRKWEVLIRENVFGLGGHRDHLPACLAHILYSNLPYGMFLTRLFRHVMEYYPHLDNGIYDVVDRVMCPLILRQTRRPRSDRGKARHSISSTSAHHYRGSSSRQDDDDKDDGTSRASIPSPTTYLNSLEPLNYQRYEIPSLFEQSDELLFERQTELLNQTQRMHKEIRGGFKSFGKALKGIFSKKKK
ncbi:hypothetical protein Tco_0533950 [Tanacetum coccineum]